GFTESGHSSLWKWNELPTASPSCPADEYRAGQVCCLACPGGYRVHRDCTATSNSLCSKCPDGTFKEGLSGQKQCSACTKCDPGRCDHVYIREVVLFMFISEN
uniref:TNFR-Cys domain-containing protein n=1 Tax=Gadus morhua TaxID=8049 RepID=A0A8C5AN39_GADMO